MNAELFPSPLEQGDQDLDLLVAAKLRAEEVLSPAIETMDTLSELLNTPVILAGGAVRDALLERPIKDYDLFVSASALEDACPALFEAGLDLAYPNCVKAIVGYSDCETPFGKEVACIFSWSHPETGTECQLIGVRDVPTTSGAQAFTDRMDFGLCRVSISVSYTALDYDRQWFIDELFLADVDRRAMTYCRAVEDIPQLERSTRRFARLHNKYPGYSLVTLQGEPIADPSGQLIIG